MTNENLIICNWTGLSNQKGGCESVFDYMAKALDAKFVTYETCARITGQQHRTYRPIFSAIERGLVVDEYLKKRESMFDVDLIIKNSAVGGYIELKTPQLCVVQDPYVDIARTMFKNNLYDFVGLYEFDYVYGDLQKRTMKKAKRRVAVSNYMKDYIERMGFKCDNIIRHGIDVELFKPTNNKSELRKKYEIPKNYKKVAIWSGTFHPVKNYHMIVNCARLIKDVFWIMIFKEFIPRKPQTKNVKFFHSISPQQVAELYNCADFCVSVSPHESFGLVPIEAMACNVPIITTPVGFFWDFWDDRCGYKVENWLNFDNIEANIKNFKKEEHNFEPRKVVLEQNLVLDRFKKDWNEEAESMLKK